jgi:GcrA cell cycle regulator
MWSDERVAELRQLWNDGLSASLIAAKFGTTRNAIIGKAHRLDLGEHRVSKTAARGFARTSLPRVKRVPTVTAAKRKKVKQPARARTRAELYAMLADAVRNTNAMGA